MPAEVPFAAAPCPGTRTDLDQLRISGGQYLGAAPLRSNRDSLKCPISPGQSRTALYRERLFSLFRGMWLQTDIQLKSRNRGFHIITSEVQRVLNQLQDHGPLNAGLCHLFIHHTSASLSINENADPDVRGDLERHFSVLAPENAPHYEHTLEGPDDMPAHIKTVLIGSDLTIPLRKGKLVLGTWQGIYLCEHRNHGGARTVTITLNGE